MSESVFYDVTLLTSLVWSVIGTINVDGHFHFLRGGMFLVADLDVVFFAFGQSNASACCVMIGRRTDDEFLQQQASQ